jgi:hypothetical protein
MEPVCMFVRDKQSTSRSSTTAHAALDLISTRPRLHRTSPIAPRRGLATDSSTLMIVLRNMQP